MATSENRRRFLKQAVYGGASLALADFGLRGLPAVRADEAKLDTKHVQFDPEIEPLVRLLEDTPRDRLLEEVAQRIRRGTSYREVLAALLLAGVRNVQPRPSVGFKFHAVLVVNSAHLASLASPDEHRWLPIFWAIDQFKSAQARDVEEGNWTMPAVDEKSLPSAAKARDALADAMNKWDEAAADAAAASAARHLGADDVFELLFKLGARDFRSIGHKAIYVANSFRTLAAIGRQHSEPIVRSLCYALLNHEGLDNPAHVDAPPDRPGRRNAEWVKKFRADWRDGKLDDGATREMLATLRTGNDEECSAKVIELVNRGVSPQSVWDGLLVGAGELLARQPGIVGLHTLTSSNALRFAYDTAANDETRRFLLLQNAAFLPLFREAQKGRGSVGDVKLDELAAAEAKGDDKPEGQLERIFQDVSGDRMAAARSVLGYLERGGDGKKFVDMARVLVFLKGRDSHDYKFSSAVLEDYANVSPAWRNRFLAASVFNLCGSWRDDNRLVARTRAALA
jgi:hypothetical protein